MDESSSLLDLLECSVCLERLDTTAKVLPCQHTFCRRCLENIVSSRNESAAPSAASWWTAGWTTCRLISSWFAFLTASSNDPRERTVAAEERAAGSP
ncbi:unnamed protein product [Tetraodon nigroviridis]|uniref:(spotted green pufferfish) hypothetical protein n=1 Tax=Tetraodon nigroviridis TaxID=99883 RepID=Q4RQV1_TETNG|nr:unnamed protein product [Tetraodon nigroviridis]